MSDDLGSLVQTAGRSLAADASGASWNDGRWWQRLQPASWRGNGFVLDSGQTQAGRRIALHEYPYRDTVWPEDLGRLPRRFAVQGFLVGDDVYQQRDRMLQAAETAGSGTLIHPTLGTVECVLLEFSCTDRRERGRVVELNFTFIVTGDILYPTTTIASGEAIGNVGAALNKASKSDLAASLGARRIIPAQSTACIAQYAGQATSAVDDPTRALNSVRGLQGLYGRYGAGNRNSMQPASATVASALSGSITSRSAVERAAAALIGAGRGL